MASDGRKLQALWTSRHCGASGPPEAAGFGVTTTADPIDDDEADSSERPTHHHQQQHRSPSELDGKARHVAILFHANAQIGEYGNCHSV